VKSIYSTTIANSGPSSSESFQAANTDDSEPNSTVPNDSDDAESIAEGVRAGGFANNDSSGSSEEDDSDNEEYNKLRHLPSVNFESFMTESQAFTVLCSNLANFVDPLWKQKLEDFVTKGPENTKEEWDICKGYRAVEEYCCRS